MQTTLIFSPLSKLVQTFKAEVSADSHYPEWGSPNFHFHVINQGASGPAGAKNIPGPLTDKWGRKSQVSLLCVRAHVWEYVREHGCWRLRQTGRDIKRASTPIMHIDHIIPAGPSVTLQPRWPEINTPITWYKTRETQGRRWKRGTGWIELRVGVSKADMVYLISR